MVITPGPRTNPRTINGAVKKGWHVVDVPRNYILSHNVSWLGLELWLTQYSNSYFISDFSQYQFAFKEAEDASKFLFHWCL